MKRVTFNPKESGQQQAASYEKPPLSCGADGCAWKGSASGDGVKFFCIGHHGVEDPRDWPAITRRTADLQWLADFIAEIQRAINMPRPGAPAWQKAADDFFAGSEWPYLAPQDRERSHGGLYVYRLLGEARAMAQGKARPKAIVPHRLHPDWQRLQRHPIATEEA